MIEPIHASIKTRFLAYRDISLELLERH